MIQVADFIRSLEAFSFLPIADLGNPPFDQQQWKFRWWTDDQEGENYPFSSSYSRKTTTGCAATSGDVKCVTCEETVFPESTLGKWIRFKSKCFLAVKAMVTFDECNGMCRKRGDVFAVISSKEEFDFVIRKTELASYWLAARRKDGVYRWADGRILLKDWFQRGQPINGKDCATLYQAVSQLQLHSSYCHELFGYMCSRPARWVIVSRDNYHLNQLCGVEIMPNCEGQSCEELCESNNNCDQFAKMHNLCVNIKTITQTDRCVVRLRPNLELYERTC